jgi:hypothetical protein
MISHRIQQIWVYRSPAVLKFLNLKLSTAITEQSNPFKFQQEKPEQNLTSTTPLFKSAIASSL